VDIILDHIFHFLSLLICNSLGEKFCVLKVNKGKIITTVDGTLIPSLMLDKTS